MIFTVIYTKCSMIYTECLVSTIKKVHKEVPICLIEDLSEAGELGGGGQGQGVHQEDACVRYDRGEDKVQAE